MDLPELGTLNLPEKEEKILMAAISLFNEKGFSASTTSEIAKRAGIAEGTIFRYFKTKKDILRGILIQMLNIFSGKMVMEGVEKILNGPEDKDLRTILKELLYDRMGLLDSVYPMVKVVITEAMHHEDVRDAIYENIVRRALVSFNKFYTKALARGIIRSDITPEAMFRAILGNLGMFIAQRKLFPDKLPMGDFDKEMDIMLDVILRGLEAQS